MDWDRDYELDRDAWIAWGIANNDPTVKEFLANGERMRNEHEKDKKHRKPASKSIKLKKSNQVDDRSPK